MDKVGQRGEINRKGNKEREKGERGRKES